MIAIGLAVKSNRKVQTLHASMPRTPTSTINVTDKQARAKYGRFAAALQQPYAEPTSQPTLPSSCALLRLCHQRRIRHAIVPCALKTIWKRTRHCVTPHARRYKLIRCGHCEILRRLRELVGQSRSRHSGSTSRQGDTDVRGEEGREVRLVWRFGRSHDVESGGRLLSNWRG